MNDVQQVCSVNRVCQILEHSYKQSWQNKVQEVQEKNTKMFLCDVHCFLQGNWCLVVWYNTWKLTHMFLCVRFLWAQQIYRVSDRGDIMRQLKGKPKKETSKDKKERKQAMQEARQQVATVVLPTLVVVVLIIVVFVYVATRPGAIE